MPADFGVMYVATGAKYIREAIASAGAVKRNMPDTSLSIHVDSDREIPGGLFERVMVLQHVAQSYIDKIEPLIQTPYAKTLFLDTDTEMIEPVYELARLLDRFDMAVCHATYRRSDYAIADCPDGAFPEFNTGVLLFNKCQAVFELFRSWSQIYNEQRQHPIRPPHDQPAFRMAVYKSSINFTVLPSEYNLRTQFPWFAGGNAKVKILHGRGPSVAEAKQSVNAVALARIGEPSIKSQNMITIEQGVAIALNHYQAARFQEAEGVCRQILNVRPHNQEALRLLELTLQQIK